MEIVTHDGLLKIGTIDQQNTYIQALFDGKTRTQAAIQAGYSGRDVRMPRKRIEVESVRERLRQKLIDHDVLTKVADTVTEGMSATLSDRNEEGKLIGSDLPDHRQRLSAAKLAGELLGVTERAAIGQATQVVINIPDRWGARYGDGEGKE